MKLTDNPMFDLHPSFVEVQAAKAVFLERVRHYAPYIDLPVDDPGYMSRSTLMACALAEVWRQGRRYQRDQDSARLSELAGFAPTKVDTPEETTE